jgi:hypothetical protein
MYFDAAITNTICNYLSPLNEYLLRTALGKQNIKNVKLHPSAYASRTMMTYLCQYTNYKITNTTYINIILYGTLKILKKIISIDTHMIPYDIMFITSVTHNKSEFIKFCLSKHNNQYYMNKSAMHGFKQGIQYILDITDNSTKKNKFQKIITNEVILSALSSGDLECIKYIQSMVEHRMLVKNICEIFAMNGHLDCIVYFHNNGCILSNSVCEYAALNGHMNCLRYYVNSGRILTNKAIENATLHNHYDCIRYCLNNGCNLTDLAKLNILRSNNINSLNILLNNSRFEEWMISILIKNDYDECLMHVINNTEVSNLVIYVETASTFKSMKCYALLYNICYNDTFNHACMSDTNTNAYKKTNVDSEEYCEYDEPPGNTTKK